MPQRIRTLLANDLRAKQAAFRIAGMKSAEIMASVPTGLPQTDSGLRLAQARADRRFAYEAWDQSLRRWKDFILHQVIPQDLRQSDEDEGGDSFGGRF